jgi:hypothetical protein
MGVHELVGTLERNGVTDTGTHYNLQVTTELPEYIIFLSLPDHTWCVHKRFINTIRMIAVIAFWT